MTLRKIYTYLATRFIALNSIQSSRLLYESSRVLFWTWDEFSSLFEIRCKQFEASFRLNNHFSKSNSTCDQSCHFFHFNRVHAYVFFSRFEIFRSRDFRSNIDWNYNQQVRFCHLRTHVNIHHCFFHFSIRESFKYIWIRWRQKSFECIRTKFYTTYKRESWSIFHRSRQNRVCRISFDHKKESSQFCESISS